MSDFDPDDNRPSLEPEPVSIGDPDAYPLLGLPAGERADGGVAGSLRQQLELHRAARPKSIVERLALPAAAVLTAAALTAVVLSALMPASSWAGWVTLCALCVGLALMFSASKAARRLIQRDPTTQRLSAQIRREEQVAKRLQEFTVDGWQILADRLLPHTGHRIPFLLVGPAGVVLVNVIPTDHPLALFNDVLYAREHDLTRWLATRRWEHTRVISEVGALGEPEIVTWNLVVHVPRVDPFKKKIPTWITGVDRVAICDVDGIDHYIHDFAQAIPREYAAMLASKIEATFPPAAAKTTNDGT